MNLTVKCIAAAIDRTPTTLEDNAADLAVGQRMSEFGEWLNGAKHRAILIPSIPQDNQ
jgi:hypothetical protein